MNLAGTRPFRQFCQFETAVAVGVGHDPSGAVVSGCEVRLQSVQKSVEVRTRTDENGSFQFLDVEVGLYRLAAAHAEFKAAIAEPFAVAVNARQRVDIGMEIGDAVESAAAIVEGDSSDRC